MHIDVGHVDEAYVYRPTFTDATGYNHCARRRAYLLFEEEEELDDDTPDEEFNEDEW